MHFLLGKKDKGGIMSMKKKKTVQKKTADIPVVHPKGLIPAKRSESAPRNPPRPALGSIGRSFSVLLDRTKVFFRPAEKADA
jgi:hypothetical protein